MKFHRLCKTAVCLFVSFAMLLLSVPAAADTEFPQAESAQESAEDSVTDSAADPVTDSATDSASESATDSATDSVRQDAQETALFGSADAGLAEGVYSITSKLNSSTALEVADASLALRGNIEIGTLTGSQSQLFYVTPLGGGLYSVKNVGSGLTLDAASSGTVKGTNIQQYRANGTAAQKWYIRDEGDGYCSITASYCDLVFDIVASNTAPGTNVRLWRSNGTAAQRWKFTGTSVQTEEPENGIYTIQSAASDKVLDVAAASAAENANIRIWNANGTAAQQFILTKGTDGTYTVLSFPTRKAMDIEGGSSANGANVRQHTANGTAAQKWKIVGNADGTYSFVSAASGKYLDVAAGSTSAGANVQIYAGNGTNAQKWRLKASAQTTSPKERLYKIETKLDTTKVLDLYNGDSSNGANIQIYSETDDSGSSNQLFDLRGEGSGWYSAMVVSSGKVLDVKAGKAVSGTNVQQYTYNGTDAQMWKFVPTQDGDGSYFIESKLGFYLDVAAAKTANNTNVQIYNANKTTAQKFYLVAVDFNSSGWYTTRSGDRSWYNEDGARVTGWNRIGIPTYYFNENGVLQKSTEADGFKIDSSGRKGLYTGLADVKPGGQTIKNFLQNALKPCGRVLYIWGGGWDSSDSEKIGYLSSWGNFFFSHATDTYNRHEYEYSYGSGLDCSGFVAWAIYNGIYSEDGQKNILEEDGVSYNSTKMATRLKNLGWATVSKSTDPFQFKPGDVVSMSGHVWIVVGVCKDGSVVLVHSSPVNGTYGGGVQLSGSVDKDGNADSMAYRLASQYMQKYFFEWPYSTACVGTSYTKNYVNKATWKTTGGIMTDPEDYMDMSAEEILADIFDE